MLDHNKHANEAVDKMLKMEAKENVLLKNSKYLWLKNDANLTEKQRQKKETLQKKHSKTERACAMRIELQEIYEQSVHRDEAEERLKKLCNWMMHARLEPMKKLCGTIPNHWDEILHYSVNYRSTKNICFLSAPNIKQRGASLALLYQLVKPS